MSSMTLAPTLVRRSGLVAEATLVLTGVLLLAVSAQVVIPLWFTPVPLTGQTFAVLLVGGAFGALRGLLTFTLYLAVGVAGAPVFSEAGSGWHGLLGPTGGYLVGMLLAVGIVGATAERGWDRKVRSSALVMLAGSAVIYAFGLTWLGLYLNTSVAETLALGAAPFIVGDLIKVALAAVALPTAWSMVNKLRG
ncbi:biotin transport system substrate-specific component [Micromonospora profundi]|uniref:biotin transporter BioY n=1 Tax=Micromonospora profundi TaxID=1420889 RepID=UPI00143CAA08|nr:biotin transporter BioY [Micromonospora profundi]NJC12960.1 biotin transport system substrate-specific component [Micromonospora profundi]